MADYTPNSLVCRIMDERGGVTLWLIILFNELLLRLVV